MIPELRGFPILLATLEVTGPQFGSAAADVRLHFVPASGGGLQANVVAVRLVQQLGWDPFQPLYFSTIAGSLAVQDVFPNSVSIRDTLQGSYRPVAREARDLIRNGDWFEAHMVPASLDLFLVIALGAAAPIPSLTGSLTLRSAALPGGSWEATVTGSGRLFPHHLPAADLTNRIFDHHLPVVPLLVQEPAGRIAYKSPDWLLPGANNVWQRCGINIDPQTATDLSVNAAVSQALGEGNYDPLVDHIRRFVGTGQGAPVVFVNHPVNDSGGNSYDNSPQRMIVLVTEQSPPSNDTLLAHELGHVLGGKDAGFPGQAETPDYWVGERLTVMDGTGDVMHGPPGDVGTFGCEHARKFAGWK